MSKELFDARIALLEEMLEEGRKGVEEVAYEITKEDRRFCSSSAGFEAAIRIVKQWKAIENGAIAPRGVPLDLPRAEEGIGP